jgi:hypothetical protein
MSQEITEQKGLPRGSTLDHMLGSPVSSCLSQCLNPQTKDIRMPGEGARHWYILGLPLDYNVTQRLQTTEQ